MPFRPCCRQIKRYVPALSKVNVKEAPPTSPPLSKAPSIDVSVWMLLPLLVQVTVVPGAMVSAFGWKRLSMTATASLPATAGTGAAAGAGEVAGKGEALGAAVAIGSANGAGAAATGGAASSTTGAP